MSNLGSRAITGSILIALVFAGIFWLPPIPFAIITGLIFLAASVEWSKLCGIQNKTFKIMYSLIILIIGVMSLFIPVYFFLLLAVVFVAALIFQLFKFHAIFPIIAGIILLPATWIALNLLCFAHPRPYYLLTLFAIVWLADTTAYCVGSLWGKHKLAPTISPGKSWEGAIGAWFVTSLVLTFWYHTWQMFFLSSVIVFISIVGDLFESLLKRRQQLKDSGNLLPGHGGILDRLDSLIAAAPVFAFAIFPIISSSQISLFICKSV